MNKTHWVKLTRYLDENDYNQISTLQKECVNADQITLKLGLGYKLAAALESDGEKDKNDKKEINEFLYFDEQKLVGYIGICRFGGEGIPLELAGMVHPEYRGQGIFTVLNTLAMEECRRRNSDCILVLCDKNARDGQSYIRKLKTKYDHSEYEMYLEETYVEPRENQLYGLIFQKAMNKDAYEIARQNSIYFGEPLPDVNCFMEDKKNHNGQDRNALSDIILPEDEEKRGMTIYLVLKDNQIIGKVDLKMKSEVGGIYGLGVLPEFRSKGYGRAILLGSIMKMKENNLKSVMLQVATENATALNLYQSCGFATASTMDYYEVKF